ncbi:MAG: Phosphatidylserine decarboxylase proenzyme [Candidatus Anoxychlamydiales bacterium]|nr:Phosphatidylserine decarboxylase proenzyme [Candidatus Anoxychlamydiales bacterium]
MYFYKKFYKLVFLLGLAILSITSCTKNDNHKPITKKLMALIKKDPEINKMLKESIAKAKEINPDKKTNPVQNLDDYLNYVDKISVLLPYENIADDMHYFYFLIDQPLPELKNKGLFKNSLQFYEPFSSWLRDLANTWRKFLDSKASWNEGIYQKFLNDPRYGLQKDWYEDASNWKTFNHFFSRYLKSPKARPIACLSDPCIVVSPADSVPEAFLQIDNNSKILVKNGVTVKDNLFFNMADLLGKNSKYKNVFANGVFTHAYLSPSDYHRYHFPVGGIVKEIKIIPGNVVVEIKWNPQKQSYDVIDTIGWQFNQTRGYVILDTGKYGLVAVISVGMDFVSSVNFEKNVRVGKTFKKGDMLGYFLFGGSDIIMLFQSKADVKMTTPIDKHILMGEKWGVMKGQDNKVSPE